MLLACKPPSAGEAAGVSADAASVRRRRAGRALSLALFASLLAGCATPRTDQELARRLEAAIAPLVAAHEFSGAVVLARRGQVVYQRGFGLANHAAAVAFTPDTPSDGASLAKTFTAAALWWLVSDGRVDVDAPAARYLPHYPHAGATVRHLIEHSSGLPADYAFFDAHFGADELRTTAAMLAVVARQAPAPAFLPGSRFEYSSFGYDVAALLIERVTGQRFEAFVAERFFVPLGMPSSFARPARLADWPGTRTLGYRWRDGAWQEVKVNDLEGFLGGSNFYFSTADVARWASANAAGKALPAAAFSLGQQRSRIGGQRSPMTGLSWYCDESGRRCYYTGMLNAFHAFAYWDRERGDAVAFMSNSALPPWRVIGLQRELVAALAGRPADAVRPASFEPFDRKSRPALAGTYVADGLGVLTISSAAGRLSLRVGDGLEFDVFQVSRDVFFAPGPDYWLSFSGGKPPAALHVRSMFVDAVARRRAD